MSDRVVELSLPAGEHQPDPSELLAELALDLRNCWNHSADPIWSEIEPELWELTHNPWVVLQTASPVKLTALLKKEEFSARVRDAIEAQRQHLNSPGWFQHAHPDSPLTCVAYFCMEFGLSEALPIYSGGLGNVAGDLLKSASDLNVPVVGVGLLYQQGYFRQIIEPDGTQHALYPYNDPGQLPITPVRDKEGEWFRVVVNLPGMKLWLRAWQVQVGRRRLYLLDSNDPANAPAYRGITSELYGGGPELRLAQEMVLGFGGWRLLRGLGITPEICHMNEGHSAFAILERAASFMEETGESFDVALAVTRAGNLFTTHTPVAAGFDRFSPDLMARFLGRYAHERLHIDLEHLLALGREHPNDPNEPFNMAHLAVRGSGAINGVSRLHRQVSRRIFHSLFERWPEAEVPVDYVTNGVHAPTWDSAEADEVWTQACGRERWRGSLEAIGEDICRASDECLWELRAKNRLELVKYVRDRLRSEIARQGGDAGIADEIFDANRLTLGFARRFATYKRPDLLLRDPERLIRILTNPRQPAQLVIAGKAHPDDGAAQAMIQKWVLFVRRPEVRRHAVFLADYDLVAAEHLVQGADVWINTPRRPWEACGTSGMKVLVNGGLNLSELDGWWAEAYSPKLGWAIGNTKEHGEDPVYDAVEAEQLYKLLEEEVAPAFYRRDPKGVPIEWISRIRESMSHLTPLYSANRALREYTENYYLPGAAAVRERSGDRGALGRALVQWREELSKHWSRVRFGQVRVETSAAKHTFSVEVYLGDLASQSVKVQLYADGRSPSLIDMACGKPLAGPEKGHVYTAEVPTSRPASDYTARVIPLHPAARVPLEDAHILWSR